MPRTSAASGILNSRAGNHPSQEILDEDVGSKYTLSDHLWRYLQDYADRHRSLGNGFGFGLPDLSGVSRTLSARYYKDGSEILIRQSNGANPRRLTPRECARLMGFPNAFEIPVSDTRAYQQFGNSVVVPVVEALAREMAKAMRFELPSAEGEYLDHWMPQGAPDADALVSRQTSRSRTNRMNSESERTSQPVGTV